MTVSGRGWWARARPGPDDVARAERTRAALGRGELPPSVVDRLSPGAGAPQASGLTVGEWTALRAGGWEPVGQVFGSAVMNRRRPPFPHPVVNRGVEYTWSDPLGERPLPPRRPEWTALEVSRWYHADTTARRIALRRLRAEMDLLGATGAVGLRRLDHRIENERVIEEALTATAVRAAIPGTSAPFVTEMSAFDLVTLQAAGWLPCGALFSLGRYLTCGWNTRANTKRYPGASGELPGPTDLANAARSGARGHLAAQLSRFDGASMVLHDLEVRFSSRRCDSATGGTDDLLADVVATATAVVPTATSWASRRGRVEIHPLVTLGPSDDVPPA